MDEVSRQQFQIHLPGLLKVLAENLYSSKRVAVRELIQNAHDSCIRRSVESGTEEGGIGESDHAEFIPTIRLSLDQQRRTLSVRDNGSGLTEDDITQYLSTIGRSYTRELGEKLSLLSPEEASRLIGQFGLGFLSAFLIAEEVVLTTRSMKPGSPALRWRSSGDVHYEVSPGEREEIGTTVELLLKPGASFLLSEETLIETARQYADFLPIPIYVGSQPLPVNLMTPPWEAEDVEAATLEYVERAFHLTDPLYIQRLTDHVLDIGHDSITVPMKGFLFVPPSSVASVREYGDLTVFIRNMFICERQRDLLPPWARFVRGVIDCPFLQPTASREDLQQDEMFGYVQQALEEQLVSGLHYIAENERPTWKKIVNGHSDVITGWAVRDSEFFDQVADLVAFRTTRGLLSLPEYLDLTNGEIYYVTREMGSLQEQLLGEGNGVPVIDASWFAVVPFLRKYADFRVGIDLVQLDGEAKQPFSRADDTPYTAILDYYYGRGVKAQIVTFSPDTVPALAVYPKDAEFIRETRQALDAKELPSPFAGLIGDYIERMAPQDDDLLGTLYLNADCPLLTQLSHATAPARNAALDLLYEIARLFSGRMLTASDATQSFRSVSSAIARLTQEQ